MKKNIVFLVDIKLEGKQQEVGRWAETRSNPYKFSIDSWKVWCKKNDCELFVLNDPIFPHKQMPVSWQRYYIFDLLDANEIEYNQIMYVDSDTMPHPDCPNVFKLSDNKLCFVHNDGSYDWLLRSIENYSKYFFDGYKIKWEHYFNSGMLIFNKNHKDFFKKIISFFENNIERLREAEKAWHVGTDQTPVNFLTHINDIDYKLLPYEFNMMDMNRKELLQEDLPFTKIGYIYHFNSIPNNKDDQLTYYWMKKTYEALYEN